MNKKLTLSLDGGIIEDARFYASEHHVSLSKLVENFLSLLSHKTRKKHYPPIVEELLGSVKIPKRIDAKKEYQKHLEEKYL